MKQRDAEPYVPSLYTQLSNHYIRSQFPAILRLLRHLAYNNRFSPRYPILKLLKAVSRRLLINQFESIFFAFVVHNIGWNIADPIIRETAECVRDIVCYSNDDHEYKCITLYLLLCGYTVKYYLNEDATMFVLEVEKACPNFKEVFEKWAKQYSQTTLKINPKNLNRVYKEIYLKDEPHNVQADFNSIVDNLLQISPSYNPEKNAPVKRDDYREVRKEADKSFFMMSTTLANLSILSSSGFLQQINPTPGAFVSSSAFLKKKLLTLGSSQFGIMESAPSGVQDDLADIRDVTLGLRTVESDCEDVVQPATRKILKENEAKSEDEPLPLVKYVSNTSDYLFHQ